MDPAPEAIAFLLGYSEHVGDDPDGNVLRVGRRHIARRFPPIASISSLQMRRVRARGAMACGVNAGSSSMRAGL